MKSFSRKCSLFLFVLLSCAIAIEYKYDRVFRHFSQRLSPPELNLPKWFGKQILFYPSDWIALFILGIVLWTGRDAIRRNFFEKGGLFALGFPLFAFLSIAASPLWNYPILYFHVWQYGTVCFLFIALTCLKERAQILSVIFGTLVWVGSFEALVAIVQYFTQSSVGLRWFGELTFSQGNFQDTSHIPCPLGHLWIFDRLFHRVFPYEVLIRSLGTFTHTNMLAGFLMMTSLITVSRFAVAKRGVFLGFSLFVQLIGLTLTFSRAGIFSFCLGFAIWIFLIAVQKKEWKPAFLLTASCLAFCFFSFQDQIVHRGGIVNYNTLAKNSDNHRVKYQTVAYQMIAKNPLLGVGFEQFLIRLPEFLPPEKAPSLGIVHNSYLLIASEMGLLSLLNYLLLIAFVIWTGWKERLSADIPCLLAIFVPFLLISGYDLYLLTFQSGRLIFFLIAGLIASHRSLKPVPVPA